MEMTIRREQIVKALRDLPSLLTTYKTPMARFLTNRDGWIIEVEHLEKDGESKLKQLLSNGREKAGHLTYTRDSATGHATKSQYYVAGLRNATFVLNVTIRDQDAPNVF